MKQNKYFFFYLFLLMGGMVMVSCSNDEDEKQQAVDISLKTMNEKGEYVTVFSSNENILFDLSIVNNTDDTIDVDSSLLLEEIVYSFRLYSSGDDDLSYPFDGIDLLKFRDTAYYFKPHETRHWQCMYMTHQTEMNHQSPFVSKRIREPLSQGEYYLLYSLTLNKERKTGSITFKVE